MPETTSAALAAKLTPRLQASLDEWHDDIVANAGGPIVRTAVAMALPVARREVPTLTVHGLDELAKELNSWTIADVFRWLANVAHASGMGETPLMRSMQS